MTETKKMYRDMTDTEFKAAARTIIRSSRSKQEVEQRLRDELGYDGGVALTFSLQMGAPPNSTIGTGMFMAMLHGRDNTISIS